MVKKIILFLCFYGIGWPLFSQSSPIEITTELAGAKDDSSKVLVLDKIVTFYRERDRDSALKYINQAIAICENNNQLLMKLRFKNQLANQLLGKQQFASGYSLLNSLLNEAKMVDQKNSRWLFYPDQSLLSNINSILAGVHYNLQILMQQTSNWKECEYHLSLVSQYAESLSEAEKNSLNSRVITGRAYAYLRREKLDSALMLLQSAEKNHDFAEVFKPFFHMVYGSVYVARMDYSNAKNYLLLAILKSNSHNVFTRSAFKVSQVYRYTNKIDSAFYFAKMLLDTLKIFGSANYEVDLGVAYKNMYQCFLAMNKTDSAFKYAQLALHANDSLSALRLKNLSEFQQLSFAEQKRLEGIETERKNKTVRWTAYLFITFSALIGFIAIMLFRNARLRKKTNAILLQEKKTLEITLEQLKSTQVQLVQSEKMASLGELTAGIAHEIQNPLNFVNNFSEVSNELIDEMKTELDKGEIATAKEIAKDVKQNLEKITHHGKRADSIVKGMLQHSRSSTGQKELTDINALCDEYLRLAYHGIRAKDSSFNVTLETDFDATVGQVMIQPQEIGRVVLNLINNALYAVGDKKKIITGEYSPIVKIITKRKDKHIEITVEDNGLGIPESIKEKIFQPFFTTKPTGQGTGLGLSLSYDIVKAHGGELKVETKENTGTIFTINIPKS